MDGFVFFEMVWFGKSFTTFCTNVRSFGNGFTRIFFMAFPMAI